MNKRDRFVYNDKNEIETETETMFEEPVDQETEEVVEVPEVKTERESVETPVVEVAESKSNLVKVLKRTPIKFGPSESSGSTGKFAQVGTYTIVEEKSGYGKLKSGIGWISLAEVTRL